MDRKLKDRLTTKLEKIIAHFNVDFAGLAFYEPKNGEFRWRIAAGSLNNRYKGIVLNKGKGVCGTILKTKREYMIERFPEDLQDDYDYLEYPILIIEELKSAAAVPLLFDTSVIGVFLVGKRYKQRIFKDDEIKMMWEVAGKIIKECVEEMATDRSFNIEEKDVEKSLISRYFVDSKKKYNDQLEIFLLDQRINLFSDPVQEKFINIFDFLFEEIFSTNRTTNIHLTIERINEYQFAVEFVMKEQFELARGKFNLLADHLRTLNGSIELNWRKNKTVLIMNFYLMAPGSERLWFNQCMKN